MELKERVMEMEAAYHDVAEASTELRAALQNFQLVQDKLSKICRYYGSKEWYDDVENNPQGALPISILSEGSVWDLINGSKDLAVSLIKTGTTMLERV